MKLVEILARELSEWPDSYPYIAQDYEGLEFQIAAYATKPVYSHGEWGTNGELELEDYMYPMECNDPATDHATAIVTREMWEAERLQIGIDAANAGKTTPLAEIKAKHSLNPITKRDLIRAIDAQLADLALERAERVAELAAEGFALLPVVDAVDMEDWRNWQAGDLLEVVDRQGEYHSFNVGDVVTMLEHDTNLGRPAPYCKSNNGGYGWVMADKMKFHTRPKTC